MICRALQTKAQRVGRPRESEFLVQGPSTKYSVIEYIKHTLSRLTPPVRAWETEVVVREMLSSKAPARGPPRRPRSSFSSCVRGNPMVYAQATWRVTLRVVYAGAFETTFHSTLKDYQELSAQRTLNPSQNQTRVPGTLRPGWDGFRGVELKNGRSQWFQECWQNRAGFHRRTTGGSTTELPRCGTPRRFAISSSSASTTYFETSLLAIPKRSGHRNVQSRTVRHSQGGQSLGLCACSDAVWTPRRDSGTMAVLPEVYRSLFGTTNYA